MEYIMGQVRGQDFAHLVTGSLKYGAMATTLCGQQLTLIFSRSDTPICHPCLTATHTGSPVDSVHNVTPGGGKQWRNYTE